MLKLMFITNDVKTAIIAEKSGVERIWVDLEILGKEERQKGMNTVKSNHTIEDVKVISECLSVSELMVRVNPWNSASTKEIDDVIEAGADLIMLPMAKTVEEIKSFISAVDSRARTILLMETKESVEQIDEILELGGIDEIHIGLNDLHLSYGLSFLFEPLTNGTVEMLCEKIKRYGIPYGFGGIARIGRGLVPAENIIAEHYRLGSTRAILSRTFTGEYYGIELEKYFKKGVLEIREVENAIEIGEIDLEENREKVAQLVQGIVQK